MGVVRSLSTRKDDLSWKVLFPFLCGVMMWFSIVLALLVRAGSGRRRRLLARRALERYVLASPGTPVPASGSATPASRQRMRHSVIVPTSIRLSTLAVVRRAVVVVGGDVARSPRMQYHAASLAKSGLFDEIVLVGLDHGNQLSETLLKSGVPTAQTFYSVVDAATGQAHLDWRAVEAMSTRGTPHPHGAALSTQYLVQPVVAPIWFEYVFPLKSLHWLACTAYRVFALFFVFAWLLMRATCIRVNAHGQMLLTDLIIIQTPPAVPFLALTKFIARPLSCLYSTLFYYCGVVPASWFHREAMRDLREQCHTQRRRDAVVGDRHKQHTQPQRRRLVFWPVLVVDWHNYGYTILRADHRPAVAVNTYKALELFASAGDLNLTVSEAMKTSLCRLPSLHAKPVVVLYDVAPAFFGPVSRQRFLTEVVRRVPATLTPECRTSPNDLPHRSGSAAEKASVLPTPPSSAAAPSSSWGIAPPPAWVYESGGTQRPRGLVVVGSTSWTMDDDYTILIEALQRLDSRLQHVDKYRHCLGPPSAANTGDHGTAATAVAPGTDTTPTSAVTELLDVWVLITGKGPARARFEEAVVAAQLSAHIVVSTLYLQSYNQYSLTLGAADLGLCLHFSSSGKDLPMKGVDMVGSGLPVAALRYPAVGELMMDDAERLRHTAAQTRDESPTSRPPHRSRAVDVDLEECTRGWLFQTSGGLEKLLSHLVGLDAQSDDLRDLLLMGPARTVGKVTATAPAAQALSSLAEMQERARQARSSAQTWEENWNEVVFPLILSVV